MIAAIMQPYFFPYIGYFQLMYAVDTFVLFDDVQYIDRGWVNRNRIALHGIPCWLTLPVNRADRDLHINQRNYLLNEETFNRIERKIDEAYRHANHFSSALPIFSRLLRFNDTNVALYNSHSLILIAQKLGIQTHFLVSSEIKKPDALRGQAKIIDLCLRIGADHYVNAIGGRHLYDPSTFADAGIRLSFLKTNLPPDQTAHGPQYFSIIDHLMRNNFETSRASLADYTLVEGNPLDFRDNSFNSAP